MWHLIWDNYVASYRRGRGSERSDTAVVSGGRRRAAWSCRPGSVLIWKRRDWEIHVQNLDDDLFHECPLCSWTLRRIFQTCKCLDPMQKSLHSQFVPHRHTHTHKHNRYQTSFFNFCFHLSGHKISFSPIFIVVYLTDSKELLKLIKVDMSGYITTRQSIYRVRNSLSHLHISKSALFSCSLILFERLNLFSACTHPNAGKNDFTTFTLRRPVSGWSVC